MAKKATKSVSDDTTSTKKSSSKQNKAPQTMDELLASVGYELKGVKKGDVIEGKVTKVTPREILIDIGGKAEGVVIDRELDTYKDMLMTLSVGDMVVAQVIVEENDRGQSVLSLRRNILQKRWNQLEKHLKEEDHIDVTVKDSVRGGILVDYGGLRGYIPQSQLESSVSRQLDRYTGRTLKVKVIELDQESNRLIFSQRAVAEEEAYAKQKVLIADMSEGDTVDALITGVVPFGAFAKITVDKDGKEQEAEGLIHISEIAWEKVENTEEHVKSGDKVKVKIIGLDEKTGKMTLSLKQLLPDPWEDVLDMFEKDTTVKGTVTRVTPYGVFVSLSPGVEGLIHISKILPGTEPQEGDDITCIVEDIQPEKRKISLAPALTEKPIGYR